MISANGNEGIWISDAGTTGVVVEQNFIGTDVTGTKGTDVTGKALGNAYAGVEIGGGAANTTIGGTTAGAGNVISANRQGGIWITGAKTTGVVVQHNFIGTDVTGTKALGNAYSGVEIDEWRDEHYHRRDHSRRWQRDLGQRVRGASGSATLGPPGSSSSRISSAPTSPVRRPPGKRVLRRRDRRRRGEHYHRRDDSRRWQRDLGQPEGGIWITGAGTTGVVVQQNFIGTDVTGTKALGNAYSGVTIDGGATNTTIGGTTAGAGNVISANGNDGHLDHRRWDHRGRRRAQFHRHRRHRYEGPGKRVLRRRDQRRRGEHYHRRDGRRRWQRDLGQPAGRHLDHRRWDHRGRRPAEFHRHRRHRYEGPGKRVLRRRRSTEARRTIPSAGQQPALAT